MRVRGSTSHPRVCFAVRPLVRPPVNPSKCLPLVRARIRYFSSLLDFTRCRNGMDPSLCLNATGGQIISRNYLGQDVRALI